MSSKARERLAVADLDALVGPRRLARERDIGLGELYRSGGRRVLGMVVERARAVRAMRGSGG